MPIQCRTGCEEQVNYEHFPFSDGFVYLLPKNLDETIHDCKNLHIFEWCPGNAEGNPEGKKTHELLKKLNHKVPEDYEKIKKIIENIPDNYEFEYDQILHMDMLLHNDGKGGHKLLTPNDKQDLKKSILNTQMRCTLFPTPFLPNPAWYKFHSDIIDLAVLYEMLSDFECAITARLIQEKITHDQTEKILELVKKQKNIGDEKKEKIIEVNISALELRDKYYRKVENVIKSFIREKYPVLGNLQKDFPNLYFKANELRSNPSKHITYSHNDVIEFLSFGACVKILKYNRKNKEKEDWNVIDYDIIDYAYYVVNRINDMDHYSDEKIEESVSKDSKALGYIFSNDIIDFFEKLEHI